MICPTPTRAPLSTNSVTVTRCHSDNKTTTVTSCLRLSGEDSRSSSTTIAVDFRRPQGQATLSFLEALDRHVTAHPRISRSARVLAAQAVKVTAVVMAAMYLWRLASTARWIASTVGARFAQTERGGGRGAGAMCDRNEYRQPVCNPETHVHAAPER